MQKWKCVICGWIYDPELGDAKNKIGKGVAFEDLPEDYRCPKCGAMKKYFQALE